VAGNKVIVLANFGTAPQEEAAEAEVEVADANDNRPQGEKVAEPFKNLKADPISKTIKLDGDYTNVFTGEKFEKGERTILLWPGDYLVLTK
jgi:hypothetical protein